jgi:hypothetical protein
MKKSIISLVLIVSFFLSGCEYDNYDAPKSELTGKIVYNNEAVGVRSNGTQLELWQYGYALRTKIPVHIAWDGTFHAKVFDGEYKIVRLKGAPWETPTDTISVTVSGNTVVDVPVTPFFVVSSVNYQKEANSIVARFTVQKISSAAALESVTLYLNQSIITDQNYNNAKITQAAAGITLGQEVTLSVALPANLASAEYLFARIGVKTSGVAEQYYTAPQKIQLK